MKIFSKGNRTTKAATVVGALALMLGTIALQPTAAKATPPSGLGAKVLGIGLLQNDFHVEFKGDDGQYREIKDVRKIATVQFEIAPGGHFGWHTHGGPAWAVITQGEVTLYRAATGAATADGPCASRNYGAGETIFDPGDANHIAVNTGTEPALIIATLMLPIDGLPRIDQPDPSVCDLDL